MKRKVVLTVFLVLLFSSFSYASDGVFPLSMTLDFDREVIQDYADVYGWERTVAVAYDKAQRVTAGTNQWVEVMGRLFTPLITWVEANSRNEYLLGDPEDVEAIYEEYLWYPENAMYFLVVAASLSQAAVTAENIDFIVEDDLGNRWRKPIVRSRGVDAQQFSGLTVYVSIFDVQFDIRSNLPDWSSIKQLTMYMLRTDDAMERVDMQWDLIPVGERMN